jgi:hypothetical protein
MRVILVTLISLWSAIAYGQQSPQTTPQLQLPLIKNGNMEQKGGQGWFFGYSGQQNSNPNGYAYDHSIEAAASGEYALRINCKAVKNDSVFCNLNQSFPATAIPMGAKLTLKAKVKTVDMVGKGISLALRGEKIVDGRVTVTFFASTEGKIAIMGTNEFEEYTLIVDKFVGNTDRITMLMIYLPKTIGIAYLDDVSVTVN